MVFFSLIVVLALGAAQAESAPLAQSPPLGWRSWNCFKLLVDQPKILEQVDALVESGLLAAGYKEIGIDDGWQACGAGINGSAHDADGLPLVNNTRFPDMLAMTKAAHQKNVSMGFYMNNCFCHKQELATNHTTYTQDVDLVVKAEFDGLKIDGCGPNHDIGKWMDAIQKSGRPITVENCGDNNNGPPGDKQRWSPPLPSDLEGDKCLRKGQFYRVSKDIAPQFYSAMYNLQYTSKYNNKGLTSPLSRPGCWAYPDMLQVGRLASLAEDRSHFAAWCVVSAPLVLGHDLTNRTIASAVHDTITNAAAILVNQQYAGHPGALVRNSTSTFHALTAHGASGECESAAGAKRCSNVTFPTYQIWSKPQPGGAVAVLIVNLSEAPNTEQIVLSLTELGFPLGAAAKATDIWTQKPAGEGSHLKLAANSLGAHASVFWLLELAR